MRDDGRVREEDGEDGDGQGMRLCGLEREDQLGAVTMLLLLLGLETGGVGCAEGEG